MKSYIGIAGKTRIGMRIYYAEKRPLHLPADHRFPAPKYGRLLERVQSSGLVLEGDLCAAPPASKDELLHVHNRDYLERMFQGQMSAKEMRRIGFPWSAELVERSRCSVGATIEACRRSLETGFSGNLGGGTHHAYPDHGEGYCVFNDVAVAIRCMQAEGRLRRAVILDLDVHQGNGTAAIFSADPCVFTFSLHGKKNYPYHKEHSRLDIALADGVRDDLFLLAVRAGVEKSLELARAELAVYIAGADPYEDDRLGRMKVSMAGLAQRDRMVFELCQKFGLPVALVMGGGYARQIDDTVSIHLQTYQIAGRIYRA